MFFDVNPLEIPGLVWNCDCNFHCVFIYKINDGSIGNMTSAFISDHFIHREEKICMQLLYLDHFPASSYMAHASDAKNFSSLSINCVGYSSSANAIAMDSLNAVKHLRVVQLTISAETVDQFENQFLRNV